MISVKHGVLTVGILMACVLTVQAADNRPIARPFEGSMAPTEPSFSVFYDSGPRSLQVDAWILGADHILAQQCDNGGFGWPHDDCSATAPNITSPICLGLLDTHLLSQNQDYLWGAIDGGIYDLAYKYPNGESRFGSFSAWFMYRLAGQSSNTTFSTFAAVDFFDALSAGTYGPNDRDTAEWINDVNVYRTGTWVNLRPWEFSTLVRASMMLGNPGQKELFVQAILDGLATLDNTDPDTVYSDLLGVAGAVRGLAAAGVTSFPAINAPLHTGVSGIDTLADLAAYLASQQNPDGSWYWHSNLAAPASGDEDVQTTAYAVLALYEAHNRRAGTYLTEIETAADWIVSLQLASGGFPSYPGGDENTEVEAEALSAIVTVERIPIFDDGFELGDTSNWSGVQN